jgi:hypothetical protein
MAVPLNMIAERGAQKAAADAATAEETFGRCKTKSEYEIYGSQNKAATKQ